MSRVHNLFADVGSWHDVRRGRGGARVNISLAAFLWAVAASMLVWFALIAVLEAIVRAFA